jgi:hypothetical protein
MWRYRRSARASLGQESTSTVTASFGPERSPTPVNGSRYIFVIHLEAILQRHSYYVAVLLLACVGCSVDARKFQVSSPSGNAVFIAPDLPTLSVLLGAETSVPAAAISIQNGTKGRVRDRKFFKSDRLVDPYPATGFDMERDRAIEVVLFEITEGPKSGVKGWIRMSLLRPDFWYL